MRREEGGVIWGFLAAIGLIVVLMAVLFAGCFSSASGQSNGMATVERHHRDRGGDGNDNGNGCQSGGCDNRSRRCDNSNGDCRSSFSPGPFKDSPVIIQFCPQQNSCNSDGRQGGDPQPGESPR